jgi:RNA polymerase sigma factor (sigma-70 family)
MAGDGRLVEQIRRGNDAAFEVLFERHGPAILAFCRHMLGSPEEAEDAAQHAFVAAYRDLQRGAEREIALKPWLFTIARNRCLSLLRARREVPAKADALDLPEPSGAGLAEQVEERADLRRLLADVRDLPGEQRAALLLTELGDLSHAEVADVLDCEVARVKRLVFRARSALIARRDARQTPCQTIREQLANLRGGALKRTELRLHLRECPGCRAYRERVREQRRMLAAALPVAPTLGLKSSVLGAIGIGGGSAGGLAAAGSVGGATVAKVAVAGVLAGGGVVAGEAIVDSRQAAVPPPASHAADGNAPPVSERERSAAAGAGANVGTGPSKSGAVGAPRGTEQTSGGKGRGSERVSRRQGRGPIDAPPASTPVRRGPPDKPWKSAPGTTAEPRGLAKGHANPAPGSSGRGNANSQAKQAQPNGGPKAGGAPKVNSGPNAKSAPKSNGGSNAKSAPKGNGGSKATGAPKANGGPKTNATPPPGRTQQGRPELNGPTNPSSTQMPNGSANPPPGATAKDGAGAKANADTAPPATTKPRNPGQTP